MKRIAVISLLFMAVYWPAYADDSAFCNDPAGWEHFNSMVAEYPEALYVPVQAVTRIDGMPTVYVRQGANFGPRQVEVGLDNNRMVHVLGGLEVGEAVLLTPPLESSRGRVTGQNGARAAHAQRGGRG